MRGSAVFVSYSCFRGTGKGNVGWYLFHAAVPMAGGWSFLRSKSPDPLTCGCGLRHYADSHYGENSRNCILKLILLCGVIV